jgi:hypothetical protein
MRIISRDSVYPWQRKKGCLREALHTVLGGLDKFGGLHDFRVTLVQEERGGSDHSGLQ